MESQSARGTPRLTNQPPSPHVGNLPKKPSSTENLSVKLPRRVKCPGSSNGTLKLANGHASSSTATTSTETSSTERQKDVSGPFQTLTLAKAMRIRFYRNGDQYFPGIVLTVSLDHYRTIDSLFERLNRVLADSTTLPHGVRYIFTIDGLKLIRSVEQLQNGHGYVCSSTEVFKPLNYLSVRQPIWCSNASRPAPVSSTSLRTYVREPNDFVYPKIITVIRNGIKPRRVVRMLLNKKTAMSFEQVMQEITALVNLNSGIVKKLLTLNRREVLRLADFFGEETVFIAYGNENKVNEEDFNLVDDEAKRLFRFGRKPMRGQMRLPVRNESINRRRESMSSMNNRDDLPGLPSPVNETFELIRVLGDGNTAVVYEALYKKTAEKRALKVIPKENLYAMKDFIDIELKLMARLDCSHIVKYFDHVTIDDSIYISLELVPEGDLFEYLRTLPFTERKAASLIRCLASALDYLHQRNIVHRDVKPENLLVYTSDDGLPCLKLADFGLAAVLEDENALLYEVLGTPSYVAPEILAELGYGPKVDIWSAGVILYVLLCGFPPFMSMEGNRDALFEMIMRGQFEFPALVWDDKSYSVKALIQGMLNIDVEERHDAEHVLEYDWVKNLGEVDEEFESAARVYYDLRVQRDADMDPDAGNLEGSSREIYYSRRASMDELKSTRGDASLGDSETSSFTGGCYPSSR